ncbi:hypothetical protein DRQ07_07250 [candidate division KSB1 bacterium]|nr:MAG: hypothetical protein DRQ07_07250 [candidate division KSB1 bacterium]
MIFEELLKRTVRKVSDNVFSAFKLRYKENTNNIHGSYRIILKDAHTGNIIEERQGNNIIVNSASILIARLLKDNREPDGGITYLAVGTGAVGWNPQNPPQPTVTQTTLENEIARKAFTDVTFIDPDTGDPTTTVPTNIVDYTATFAETEAVGPLVEMGLFGGNASGLLDSGTQINYRTFPVVNKTSSMTLTIIFRITS